MDSKTNLPEHRGLSGTYDKDTYDTSAEVHQLSAEAAELAAASHPEEVPTRVSEYGQGAIVGAALSPRQQLNQPESAAASFWDRSAIEQPYSYEYYSQIGHNLYTVRQDKMINPSFDQTNNVIPITNAKKFTDSGSHGSNQVNNRAA